MRRVKALPRHAVDDHSQCDYHPLVVCSCGACENKDQIVCQGKPYKTKFRLDCAQGVFILLYFFTGAATLTIQSRYIIK